MWNMLTIITPERRQWHCSRVFNVDFKFISHLFLVLILLNLNKEMLTRNKLAGMLTRNWKSVNSFVNSIISISCNLTHFYIINEHKHITFFILNVFWSSRSDEFFKKDVLRNFAKFTEHLCSGFYLNFTRFLITPFLQDTSGGCFWVFLYAFFWVLLRNDKICFFQVFLALLSNSRLFNVF